MKNGMFIYVLLPLTNTVSQFERRISIPQLQVRGALSGGEGGMLMSVGVKSSH